MDIPEILKNIASHLDPASLISASQVSTHWHTVITPLIWATIHPQDWTHQAFRPRTLYKNAHLVRGLGWNAMTSSGAYMYQQAAATRDFENMVTGRSFGPCSQLEADVRRSSGLPSLSSLLGSEDDSMTLFDVGEQWEEGDPFVKRLREQKQKEATADNKTRDGQVLPPTATGGGAFPHPIPSAASPTSQTPPLPQATTTTTTKATATVSVPPVLEHLSLTCLTKIVGQCTNLQRLCLHTTTTTVNEFGVGACAGGMHVDMIPVLQSLVFLQDLELYVNRVVVYQDQEQDKQKPARGMVMVVKGGEIVVQDLIRRLNQLSRLSLRGSAFIFNTPPPPSQDESTPTASTSAPTPTTDTVALPNDIFSLQHLTLDTPYISSSELTHLLTQCPRLKSLDLPGGLATWTWSPTASDTFLQTLRTFNKHLCEFSINASAHPAIPEEQLVALVRYGFTTLRPIRRFGARACQFPEGEIFLALLEQQEASLSRRRLLQHANMDEDVDVDEGVKGLEELDISLAKRMGPLFRERLYEFLERAEGLKRVEAAGVWIALDDLLPNNINTGEQPQQPQQQDNGDAGALPLPPPTIATGAGELLGQQGNLPTIAQAQAQALATTTTTTTTTPQPLQSLGIRCSRIASSKTLLHLHIGFTHPTRTTPLHLNAMFTLLSSLKNLHHLQLSYTCVTLPSSSTSSSFSPAPSPTPPSSSTISTSPPDHPFHTLASLHNLRVFNIETCAYPLLTRFDVEWMLQNWPRLEKLVFNQLGASRERMIKTWLKEFGREDLKVESSQPAGTMYF